MSLIAVVLNLSGLIIEVGGLWYNWVILPKSKKDEIEIITGKSTNQLYSEFRKSQFRLALFLSVGMFLQYVASVI